MMKERLSDLSFCRLQCSMFSETVVGFVTEDEMVEESDSEDITSLLDSHRYGYVFS